MKLGGYGCFRVAVYLMPFAANELAWIFLILTGISVVYGAFCACVQTDLKYINAYSSVSHCGLVLFAILMLNTTAMTGAIMQMLSHGLMTALVLCADRYDLRPYPHPRHPPDGRPYANHAFIWRYAMLSQVWHRSVCPAFPGFVAEMTISCRFV